MKKIISLFCLMIMIVLFAPLSVGCQNYPESALYVGEKEKYSTIQSAIDASTIAGQYIVVSSGTYMENLFISKPVKLIGKTDSVILAGSATVSTNGISFENLVFDGTKTESQNAIEIDNTKNIEGLSLKKCTIKKYKNSAVYAIQNPSSPHKFTSLLLDTITFSENKNFAITSNCVSNLTIVNSLFKKNGLESENNSSAINLEYIEGEYSSVIIMTCEFKNNGNDNDRSGAIVCSNKNSYKGELILDDCLFQFNSHDVISGYKEIENSSIEISIINPRGLTTKVEKLDEQLI